MPEISGYLDLLLQILCKVHTLALQKKKKKKGINIAQTLLTHESLGRKPQFYPIMATGYFFCGHKRNSISLDTFFLCYQWAPGTGKLLKENRKKPSSRENKIQLVKLSSIKSINRNNFQLLGIKNSILKGFKTRVYCFPDICGWKENTKTALESAVGYFILSDFQVWRGILGENKKWNEHEPSVF